MPKDHYIIVGKSKLYRIWSPVIFISSSLKLEGKMTVIMMELKTEDIIF